MDNPKPRIAAIDVGSNTLRLLIVEMAGPQNFVPLHEEQAITRLGEGLGQVGADPRVCPSMTGEHMGSPLLSSAATARSLAVLKQFGERAREYGVQEILAVGTRALREAANGKAFAEAVEQEAGYPLRIIDGGHEARLALMGVFGALPHLDNILLVDIGGGSTEFTLAGRQGSGVGGRESGIREKKAEGRRQKAESSKIVWSDSTDLGVVRLLEQFLQHDPPTKEEIIRLSEYIKEKIKGLIPAPRLLTSNPCLLVGTAGTYTTLAALDQEMKIYNPAKINGYSLTSGRLRELEEQLYSLPLEKRKALAGLEPGRADVILPGATLARTVNEVFGYKQVVISDGGLREGIVWEWIKGSQ
jgi:exopolyphosphatase/guanosine-5'-triphosphate,3'-diphosphate pyrophosphatase